jgi:hypoxanthine-guanine phosphoribosyltransferase
MPYSRILVSREQLAQIVSDLAGDIRSAYQGVEDCLALVVLEGSPAVIREHILPAR